MSKSGYYNWLKSAAAREAREKQDQEDIELIRKVAEYGGYPKGYRAIQMQLLQEDKPVLMNLKKIQRLARKGGIKCEIRSPSAKRRQAKAVQEHRVVKNILNRNFKMYGPRKVLLMDITYLHYGADQCAYLSTLIDAYTREVLAWKIGAVQDTELVLETVRAAVRDYGIEMDADTLVHTDQGCQYTSIKFGELLRELELRQSMSRRGNCWDNSPQETFFGHMKDEINLLGCTTLNDVERAIAERMEYYNNRRGQWELAKLPPAQYYEYCKTGEHPFADLLPDVRDRVAEQRDEMLRKQQEKAEAEAKADGESQQASELSEDSTSKQENTTKDE